MPFKLEGAQDASQTKPFKLEGAQDVSKAEPSFTERVREDYSNRASGDIGKKLASGEISKPSAALQTLEQGGGLIGDVMGEGVKSGLSYVPEAVKQPVAQKAKQAAEYVAGTDIGKAGIAKARETKQAWDSFAKKHPEAAQDLAGLPNLLNFIPARSVAGAAGSALTSAGEKAAPALKKVGENLVKSAEEQAATKRTQGFVDLISPKVTKKIAEENVGKTVEKGLLRSQEVVPDKFTKDIADTVSKVPGVNPSRSYQYNFNKISAENRAEARKLYDSLKTANIAIPKEKIAQAAENVRNSLAKQTFMVGDSKKASNLMMKEAGNLLKKNGYTADGLLKTRQEFDAWAKSQIKGITASETNTARKASWTAIRDSLNNLIAESAPNANVRASLTKQHHLFNALNNIKPKAAKEGKNILTRSIATAEDILPTSNPYLKHAAGLAGIGLAATHPATLAAAVPYAAYKGVTSPITRKVVGKGLTKMGDILATP